MNKNLVIISPILMALIAMVALVGMAVPQTINADLKNPAGESPAPTIVHNGHLTMCMLDDSSYQVVRTMTVGVTGYSSTEDQTDDTPFITASGKHVADGIVANNNLPFGTRIRIPSLFGSKVLVVEDKMHPRFNNVDVWFSTREAAIQFGFKTAKIEILEN